MLVHVYLPDLEHDPFITQSLYHRNCPREGFQEPPDPSRKTSSGASDDKSKHVSSHVIMQFVSLVLKSSTA